MILALDVGGSTIKYGLFDNDDKLLKKGESSSSFSSSEEFAKGVQAIYEEYGEGAEAVAMSYCGELDPENGYAYSGGSLIYNTGVELRTLLQKHLPVPITIENDGNCGALAEMTYGALRGIKNGAVLGLGSGVAGSIVIDGKLYRGSHFSAGSVSPSIVSLRDALAPGSTLVEFLSGQPVTGFDPGNVLLMSIGYMGLTLPMAVKKGWNPAETDGRRFFESLANGDKDAEEILDQYCSMLAGYIYNLQCILDLDVIAIGGGISQQPVLIEKTKAFLAQNFGLQNAMGLISHPPVVCACELSADANLYGAVCHYKQEKGLL